MILSAKSLLDRHPAATEMEIMKSLSGILCRCGSYKKILTAINHVVRGGERK
jgi:aerobic-type carbon monoxide dehydrogenase small subunit (CoxS/CutS family)